MIETPVNKRKVPVGELSPGSPVSIDINYDDIALVERIRVRYWGSGNQNVTCNIDVADSIELAINGETLESAININARIYTVHAVLKSGEELLLVKGRLCLTGTN